MLLKQTLEVLDVLDNGFVNGQDVVELFNGFKHVDAYTEEIGDEAGTTHFVKFLIKGTDGKASGGLAPTMGIIGRLGGIGARPSRIGFVSDGDGAAAAITAALKLAEMSVRGDRLKGDVLVTTHVCPDAPTQPHEPVDFMGSPIDMETMNKYEVDPTCDAIVSIDTTKGNLVMNEKGISISPTVKEGYILPLAPDLVRILSTVTGEAARTFALSLQDITPYGNGLYHLNSILQPATSTKAPVIGVAITTASAVAGCATGASHEIDIALAATYAIEVAKEFTQEKTAFYDKDEFAQLQALYGSLTHLQTLGEGGIDHEKTGK